MPVVPSGNDVDCSVHVLGSAGVLVLRTWHSVTTCGPRPLSIRLKPTTTPLAPCVTVTVCPAIVTVPVRGTPPVFAATVRTTLLVPVRLMVTVTDPPLATVMGALTQAPWLKGEVR